MPRIRIPEGESWKDHAMPCPNCKQPVLSTFEHFVQSTMTDPAWYTCDRADDEDGSLENDTDGKRT